MVEEKRDKVISLRVNERIYKIWKNLDDDIKNKLREEFSRQIVNVSHSPLLSYKVVRFLAEYSAYKDIRESARYAFVNLVNKKYDSVIEFLNSIKERQDFPPSLKQEIKDAIKELEELKVNK